MMADRFVVVLLMRDGTERYLTNEGNWDVGLMDARLFVTWFGAEKEEERQRKTIFVRASNAFSILVRRYTLVPQETLR